MKEKVITILTEGRRELLRTRKKPTEGQSWEEEIFSRLTPYLRSEFPEQAIIALLTALRSGKDFNNELQGTLGKLRRFWESERRSSEDRRKEPVQTIDLESGKLIWYDHDESLCGFNRRSGLDRRTNRDYPV